MSFNALDVFLKEKGRFANARGATPSSTGKMIPRTTYKDVYSFGVLFLAKTSAYAYETCTASLTANDKLYMTSAFWKCEEKRSEFVHTASYKSALSKFESQLPLPRLVAQNPYTAVAQLQYHLSINDEYPWNKEFWEAANTYAIARNAAGVVPSQWDYAIESVQEAIQELPARIAGTLGQFGGFFPKFNLEKIMLWSIIGVGGYFIIKMVMEKKKKA